MVYRYIKYYNNYIIQNYKKYNIFIKVLFHIYYILFCMFIIQIIFSFVLERIMN